MRAHGLLAAVLAVALAAWAGPPVLAQGIFGPPAKEEAWPVPEAAAQQKALKAVEEVYRGELSAARAPAQKRELAEKLLAAAPEADDPAERFALLKTARDLAGQSGDVGLAFRAAEATARWFRADGFALKLESLEAAVRSGAAADQKALAESGIALADEAVARDEFDAAGRLNRLAAAAARKSRDAALSARATAQARDVEKAARAFRKVQTAQETLRTAPGDPEANLTVGRYLCLVKGDWERGLSMLALGSDERLRPLAERELRGPEGAAAQVALADGWWDLAEQEEGLARQRLQARAAHWYAEALPQLTGLDKTKAEKRVAVPGPPPAKDDDYLSGAAAKSIVYLHYANKTWRNDGAPLFEVTKTADGHRVACAVGPGGRYSMMLFPKENVATRKLVVDLTVEKGKCNVSLRPPNLAAAGTVLEFSPGSRHSVELWIRNGVAQALVDGQPTAMEHNRPENYGHFALVTDGETVVVVHRLRFVDRQD